MFQTGTPQNRSERDASTLGERFAGAEGDDLAVGVGDLDPDGARAVSERRLDAMEVAAEPELREGIQRWVIPGLELRENDVRLAPGALERITMLPTGDFEALLDYPIHSARSAFSIRPGFERLGVRVLTSLKFQTPDGAVRGFGWESIWSVALGGQFRTMMVEGLLDLHVARTGGEEHLSKEHHADAI